MKLRFWPAMIILAGLLLTVQIFFLPRAGMEADEALFVAPFLKGVTPLYFWHAGRWEIPVMSMDYIGGLKSWLYWGLFRFWPPNVWSIRLPPCLFSIATLMIVGDTARRVAGNATALLTALFLATDAIFIFTNVYDWGPVALLLLGLAACLGLLQRYAASGRGGYLSAAFLVAGVATWYKAIFVFPAAGLLVALAVVYHGEFRRRLSPRVVASAMICFAAGASPLISYNLVRHGATVTATTYIGSAPVNEKLLMMRRTLDGRALEHYMFRSSVHERLPLAGAPLPDLVMSWYRDSKLGSGSILPELLLASLAMLPFLRGQGIFRPLLFAWVASATAFGLMLGFHDAGAGPHHTVLIYPGPHFIVAATLAAVARRAPRAAWPVFAAAGCGLVGSNLYLLHGYLEEARQNGFSVYWTASSRELTNAIHAQSLPVAFLDWGIEDVVRVESGDQITLAGDAEPREGVLYVGRCRSYVVDALRMSEFEQKLAASRLRRTEVRQVLDKQGEPVFCMSSLVR